MVRNKVAIFLITGMLLPTCARSSWAQTSGSNDLQTISALVEQIKELQQHDRDMQERIRVLEANQKPAGPSDSSTPAATTPAEAQAIPTSRPPASEMHTWGGIQWRGFGEVNYKALDQRVPETGTYGFVPGSAGNFYTGDFGLFLTSRLSDKSSVLAEMDFEEGDAQKFKVDMRRMLLKYDINDHLKFALGRYQTNIGYYNWAFRSASWLQTTADRPLVMEFASNGGLLPTQAVGVSVAGSVPSGKLGLHYIAEYGSSDTVRPDINGDGLLNDENNGNQINVGLFIQPEALPGLRIGGSYYRDQISDLIVTATGMTATLPPGSPSFSARWNQTIVNGHVVYVAKRIEFLNEGFLIRHALIGGSDIFNTPAFYTQFSKKFGPLRPFARYEYVNASQRNVIYDDIGLRAGPSFGVRYDLTDYIAFKAQVDRTIRRGLPDLNGLHLQLTGTF